MSTGRRFQGKVVVVTGASSGIGAAAGRGFAAEGARVVLVARGAETLEKVASEINARGGSAFAVPTDVGDAKAAAAMLARVATEHGAIDVLVNNAGVNHRGAVEERTPEELAEIVNVNLIAPILLTRAVLPHLRRRGGGSVVNVASLAGRVPLPHEATYSATKFGLRAFSFSLAEELEGSGIKVSVVSPGPVDTGFIASGAEDVPAIVFTQPMSTADEIAKLVIDAAETGVRESTPSRMSGVLTTVGYLLPGLRRRLAPVMERRGQAAKARYVARVRAR